VKRAATLVVSAMLVACSEDPSVELRKDLERLKTERVEIKAVEKAQAELGEVTARIEAARRVNEEKLAALPPLEQKRDALKAVAGAERAKIPGLEAEKTQAQEDTKRAIDTAELLDAKIARAQARGAWVRDQIAGVVRELRPGDPQWAMDRRLGTLRELMARYHKEWAADPVLSDASAELMAVGRPEVPPEKAREVADRIGARLTAIYDLPPPGVALTPPAPSSPAAPPAPAPAASSTTPQPAENATP
jgi:hypothetical protein